MPDLEFRLLGALEVRSGGSEVPVKGHRLRVVLTMLLLEPGRAITTDRLVEAVWDGSPPKTAETQIQICVSQLRKLLAQEDGVDLIDTTSAGYLIRVAPEAIDVFQVRQLVNEGRSLAADGDLDSAAARLRAALDLWRGDAAADVNSRLVQAAVVRIGEELPGVLQEWMALELELGRHQEHIGTLTELVARYPLREKMHVLLALALYRSSRQAEALTACRHARELLVEEHGLDPGEELQQLERAILDNAPDLAAPVRRREAIRVPHQLPATQTQFAGRTEAIVTTCEVLAAAEEAGAAPNVRVVAISGAPGVGKSALAIYAAHQVSERYPDGQLYAHLRGADARPVRSELVLGQFLRALGVSPATLPSDPQELAGLYRSTLATRRVLIVLDDAADEAQVRPLMPGGSGCAVAVTSRRALPGIPGARWLKLEPLDSATSVAFFEAVIGSTRVAAEPEAATALADACGGLPLALQVAAAKLAVMDHWRLAQLVERLADERRLLDELTAADVGVRPSLAISYGALSPPAARLLMLLSMLGAADFAGWVAQPLLEVDFGEAADVLDELVEFRLVQVQTGHGHLTRYRLHDLTRAFAREKAAEHLAAGERADAQYRLLRSWLFLASEAHRREFGGEYLIIHSDVSPWWLPPAVTGELLADPMQWFQSEYANLVAAVSLAAQLRRDDLCWDLSVTAVTLFETGAYYDAWRDTHSIAMDAVRQAGNRRGEAMLHYSLGGLGLAQGRFTDAEHHLERALAQFLEAEDEYGYGLTLRNLALVDRIMGRHDNAIARYREVLDILRKVGDPVAVVHALRGNAQLELTQGNLETAEEQLRESLTICSEVGGRRVLAQVRYRLGQVLLARGEFDGAEEAFTAVLELVNEVQDAAGQSYALLGMGQVHLARGDLERGEQVLRDALAATRRTGRRFAEGEVLVALARLQLARGDLALAHGSLDAAQQIVAEFAVGSLQQEIDDLRQQAADAAS